MRVLQVIDNLRMGGAQKLLTTLASLANSRNIDLTVVNLSKDLDSTIPPSLEALGAEVCSIVPRTLFDPLVVRELAGFVRERQFDIIHTHLSTANILGTLAGRLASVPTIATLHSVASRPSHRHRLDQLMETYALRYGASAVIAVAHSVAHAHQGRLGNTPIIVVPNGVEPAVPVSQEVRRHIRTQLAGDPDRLLLISVGRLVEVKGYSDLLRGFQDVHKMHPSAALSIVGNGNLHHELANQIRYLDLKGHVFLSGERDDVPILLASSDLYVNSSHWEGLPVSVLEAMMAGLPIVATSVGDTPQILTDGTGVTVPPGESAKLASAVCTLLSNPEQMKLLGCRAQQRAIDHFSSEAWVDKLTNIYKQYCFLAASCNHDAHSIKEVG